jgi:hypothetical protein
LYNIDNWYFYVNNQKFSNQYTVAKEGNQYFFILNSTPNENSVLGFYSGTPSNSNHFTIESYSIDPNITYCSFNYTIDGNATHTHLTNEYVIANGTKSWYLSPTPSSSSSSDTCNYISDNNGNATFTLSASSNELNYQNIGIIGSLAGVMEFANPNEYKQQDSISCAALTYYSIYMLNKIKS